MNTITYNILVVQFIRNVKIVSGLHFTVPSGFDQIGVALASHTTTILSKSNVFWANQTVTTPEY